MKKITLIILALVIGFTSCTQAKTVKKKKKVKQSATEIISVKMHRTACFGSCPDYTIEINKDGNVVFTGFRFTDDTGVFKKNIGVAKSKEIIAQFVAYRADTCQELYENRIPDLPGLNFEIKYPAKTKKIFCANFGPGFLKELADAMDAAGKKDDSKGWKKTGPAPKRR